MQPFDNEENHRQAHIENDPATPSAADAASNDTPPADLASETPVSAHGPCEESGADTTAHPHEPVTDGASFQGSASPDGTGYSTPNGGHGYAYAPEDRRTTHRRSLHRSMVLAVAGILACAILIGAGVVGAWSVVKGMRNTYGTEFPGEGDSEYGTCGDLLIDENESSKDIGYIGQPGGYAATDSTGTETGSLREPPLQATIDKREPSRTDADGDGRADIAYDANGQVLTSANGATDTAATVVAKVANTVVEIYTETVTSSWYGQYVSSGAGSGVIVSPEGHIVTNHHVVDGARSITVRLTDGKEYTAKVIGSDEQNDIAVLWIDAGDRSLSVAKLGSSYDLVVGEEILAIGNPMGSLGGTVTYGRISATARSIAVGNTHMTLLQVDAPINPGNSGGALFNMAGELVGVVNAKMSDEEIEGLGFAIPIDTAYDVMIDLITYGYVTGRPAMGLTLRNLQTGSYLYAENHVYIVESAYSDELKAGDLLMKMDDISVSTVSDVTAALTRYRVGDTVKLTVLRNNETLTVSLTLREYRPA